MESSRDIGERWARKLVEEIYRDLRSQRRLGQVARAAGLDHNYPRDRLKSGTMDLAKFCSLIHASGKSLPDFVSHTLDLSPDGELIPRPTGVPPEVVARAQERISAGDTDSSVERPALEAIDMLRLDDPEKARDRVAALISFVSSRDVGFALGIYASCSRPLSQLREAWWAIAAGLEIEPWGSPVHPNLIQRASSLHRERCNYRLALATSERATVGYARLGNFAGVGQTLIDQGTLLWHLDRGEEAEWSFRQGLGLLAPTDRKNHCAGHHALAILAYFRGNSAEALEASDEALPLARSNVERGKIQWLKGCCLADLDQLSEAYAVLDDAFVQLSTAAPVDAALLVCDQLRLMLHGNDVAGAYRRARAIRSLIIPLERRNPTIAAAVLELAAIELEAGKHLTLELVESVKERIREASRPKAPLSDPLTGPY